MSTSPILSNFGPIATFTGAAFPVAYADPVTAAIKDISRQTGSTAWARITTDAASNFTSVNLQLVDSYDKSAGSWIANVVTPAACASDASTVTLTGSTTIVVTVAAGKTYWVKMQTANTLMGIGGASVVVWGSGGIAKSGDVVTLYLVASEGA